MALLMRVHHAWQFNPYVSMDAPLIVTATWMAFVFIGGNGWPPK
jgi:hypothetical protein